MKSKSLLLLIAIFTLSLSVHAQKDKPHFDVEKHHREQADFFTKELELTPAEKEAFVPLLQEYFHARYVLNKDVRNAARELMKSDNKLPADYQKVIDMGLDAKIKEAELQKEYFKKFGEVIPAKKLVKYTRAERKFMERAVERHHRGGDKK